MFGSEILDVVIGMIFIFLVLSLICSAVNELIEAWLNKRADYLERGIKELLGDTDGSGYLKALYRHPLVAGLFRGKYGEEVTGWRAKIPSWLVTVLRELGLKKTLLPSYIPAQNFTLALLDIVLNPSTVTSPPPPFISLPTPVTSPPAVIISPPAEVDEKDPKATTIKALRVLIEAAGGNPAMVKANIENWFNNSMDRVSGWYKRRTQVIILILGLVVTAFINADSIAICNSLTSDKALRTSLVAAAQEYAKADANQQPQADKPKEASKEFKEACKANKNSKGLCSEKCLENVNLPECKLDSEMTRIKSLGLPIGWDTSNADLFPPGREWKLLPKETDWALIKTLAGNWLLKICGLLITAFAISLGAPFWFDLLNKFMVVRSTVKPKEKSREDSSKD